MELQKELGDHCTWSFGSLFSEGAALTSACDSLIRLNIESYLFCHFIALGLETNQ